MKQADYYEEIEYRRIKKSYKKKVIKELIKENRAISFSAVAQIANVSRTYLYQNKDIKEKNESLRSSTFSQKSVSYQLRPSESSKNTIVATLKPRIEKLDRENYGLISYLEVAYGLADPDLVEKVGELQKKIGELEEKNKNFKEKFKNTQDELEDLKYNLDDN
jgi:peptidoglycan hydrolase CwlO-like protein